jgi:hypothetical protein
LERAGATLVGLMWGGALGNNLLVEVGGLSVHGPALDIKI